MTDKPWRNPDKLRQLYHAENMSLREVADELGCSRHAVQTWMEKHGIDRDDMKDVAGNHQRSKPTHYRTNYDGYEVWNTMIGTSEQHTVRVHRLIAVAEYGVDAVNNNHIHHKNKIPWDNRPCNLEVLSPSEHLSQHMSERVDKMLFDDEGDIAGWADAQ